MGGGVALFGKATAYPHRVPYPQTLYEGDMVLIDCGGAMHGYVCDITRSYVFGEPTPRQREIWNLQRASQDAAFAVIHLGVTCGMVDDAARAVIAAAGLGPDYAVPGLPHRVGHGVGMDVHEGPYFVCGNTLPMAVGMTGSIEPTICLYDEFGVRVEDHFFVTAEGAAWHTQPSPSTDDPFADALRSQDRNERRVPKVLGLVLNEDKTKLCDARRERFDFLGYRFGPHCYRKAGRWYLGASPSHKGVQRLKTRLRGFRVPGNLGAWPEVRDQVNRVLVGWSSYYGYGTRYQAYRAVDNFVSRRVRHFLRRRHKMPNRATRRLPIDAVFDQLGVVRLRDVHLRASPCASG